MSEKHLLLPSARLGIPVEPQHFSRWHVAAVAVGLFVILIGVADVSARLAEQLFGERAGVVAFGPAAAVGLPAQAGGPSFLASLSGGSATTTTLIPTRVVVEAAGVSAPIVQVGMRDDGAMDTPKKLGDVAWYSPGAKPGQAGNAVFAGHVNNALGIDGVFANLSDVSIGDVVVVSDDFDQRLTYVVHAIDLYPIEAAPAASIFATTGPSQVVLVTCEGVWDVDSHSYSKRLVVTARLAR